MASELSHDNMNEVSTFVFMVAILKINWNYNKISLLMYRVIVLHLFTFFSLLKPGIPVSFFYHN